MVSGTARFTVGETTYDAPAGTFAMIPPGAPHTFANPGDQTVVLLNTFTVVPNAGHLPHFEQPDATFAALDGFLQSPTQRRA